MTDHISRESRSENMRRIKGANTQPELVVRRALFALGLRYRLHDAKLPGKPDIVMRTRGMVIFVHGCFWHQHENCRHCRTPQSNAAYWSAKLARNVARDVRHVRALRSDGWRVLTIWECETKDLKRLKSRLARLAKKN